jgi:acyl transferase domain-containing protein/thioesterase domain-containing protein
MSDYDTSLADEQDSLSIAIIGMAGRFPGADSVPAFWRNLCAGVDALTPLSDRELAEAGVSPAALASPAYVKAAMLLEGDVALFDGAFFGYSPREAELLDPQQRLFLECAWEALEDAGRSTAQQPGPVGLFAGVSLNTYLFAQVLAGLGPDAAPDYFQIIMGADKDFLTTRASYKLGLTGPSVTVQTACSTSLVAVHLACQSLLSYHCDMALAGGSSVSVPQRQGYLYQPGGIFSPDGRCRAFDAGAAGTIKGSGVGVVVLKRLQDALADGDQIYAVIRGSAVNNDGSVKIGYTAPSQDGQAQVIRAALAAAGADPERVGYIEAHGTGTPLGDPIEVAALTQVFRAQTGARQFCGLGSVKTNIGHLDVAAGVAGLIKAALAVRDGRIPPSLHFRRPNPQLDLASSPFYVAGEPTPWPEALTPRLAGVSSFGIGGTNAHVVLEQPPELPAAPADPWQLLPLSARTPAALDRMTERLAEHLERHPGLCLADAAYTLQVGRQEFGHRRVFVCADAAAALRQLRDPAAALSGSPPVHRRPVVLMFPGGGAQYPGMAAGLYDTAPVFRAELDRCLALLRPLLGEDLRPTLFGQQPDAAARLERTRYALPALFAVEYALARQLTDWGLRPHALIGHSLGEYTAACLAGVFSLESALALVTLRGKLFERIPAGAMVSLPLPEETARGLLGERLSLAAVNGPASCVVAGAAEDIAALTAELERRGQSYRRIPIATAAHASLVEPLLEPFAEFVRTIPMQAPALPFVSNVTGSWADPEEVRRPDYWVRHLRQTVRFGEGISALLSHAPSIFVEVGPGQTLGTLTRLQSACTPEHLVLSSLRHPHDQTPDRAVMMTVLGRLWLGGVALDWPKLHPEPRRRVSLPSYPFERQRYWIEARPRGLPEAGPDTGSELAVPVWQQSPPAPQAEPEAGPWLIFSDRRGLGAALAARLRQHGRRALEVAPDDRAAQPGGAARRLAPSDPDACRALLEELAGPDEALTILHCWSLDAGGEADLGLGTSSLLALARAAQESGAPLRRVVAVSSGLEQIHGGEPLLAANSALLGPAAALDQLAAAGCRTVDLDRAALSPRELPALAAALLGEAGDPGPERLAAYRGRQRWLRRQIRPRLPGSPEPPLQSGATYALLDSADNAGRALAVELARRYAARVVIIGPASQGGARDSLIGGLRHPVIAMAADPSDPAQLQRALAQADGRYGPVRGLIHIGLGQPDPAGPPGLPAERPLRAALEQLARAIAGLGRAAAPLQLDFCALLLPHPAPGGAPRPGALALWHAANALAQQAAPGRGWMCLGWDGWRLQAERAADLLQTCLGLRPLTQATLDTPVAAPPQAPAPAAALAQAAAAAPAPAAGRYPRPDLAQPYTAPRSALEQQLAGIWGAVLGIDPVGVHDNFFELRGDSLLALQLAARLQETGRRPLALRELFERPTVAGLAELLSGPQTGAAEPSDLVCLNGQGERPPFWCIHPAGGIGLCYAELARLLGPDQPFYTFQARGADGEREPRGSVQAMAQSYLAELRAVQPDGPYLLGGWSMGGSIAFEMARLLRRAGQEVALLALIDTPAVPAGSAPDTLDDEELAAAMLGPEIGLTPADLRRHTPERRLELVLERASQARVLPEGLQAQQFRRVLRMFRTHANAWWNYRPQPYDGPITVLRAAEPLPPGLPGALAGLLGGWVARRAHQRAGADLGWSALTSGDVTAVELPGNHQTLVKPPHVQALADQLRSCLDAAVGPARTKQLGA